MSMDKRPAFHRSYRHSIGEADREDTNISKQAFLDSQGVTKRTEEICPKSLKSEASRPIRTANQSDYKSQNEQKALPFWCQMVMTA
jgi:hypothetical protein